MAKSQSRTSGVKCNGIAASCEALTARNVALVMAGIGGSTMGGASLNG
ncbi:hypothetical protein BHJ80_01440 [Escherichia coli]|nr:hypothetical protein BHJ80_01440 [Escherichia coli]